MILIHIFCIISFSPGREKFPKNVKVCQISVDFSLSVWKTKKCVFVTRYSKFHIFFPKKFAIIFFLLQFVQKSAYEVCSKNIRLFFITFERRGTAGWIFARSCRGISWVCTVTGVALACLTFFLQHIVCTYPWLVRRILNWSSSKLLNGAAQLQEFLHTVTLVTSEYAL